MVWRVHTVATEVGVGSFIFSWVLECSGLRQDGVLEHVLQCSPDGVLQALMEQAL